MTTFKISIKHKRDAALFLRMMQKLSFVDKIEKIENIKPSTETEQFYRLEKLLKEKANPGLFSSLSDPVSWQKKIRNEWE